MTEGVVALPSDPQNPVFVLPLRLSENAAGFESDGLLAQRRGHSLPLPVNTVVPIMDLAVGGGESGSASVSSRSCLLWSQQGLWDKKLSSRAIIPVTGSRSSTARTSPLHLRLLSPGSDNRQDERTSQCLPLPLPQNLPTSPPTLPNKRTRVVDEIIRNLCRNERRENFGRWSFGHVYVRFMVLDSDSGQMCAIKEVKVVQDD